MESPETDEPRSFLQRNRWVSALGLALAVAVLAVAGYFLSEQSPEARPAPTPPPMVAIQLPPPPPPPPPPPEPEEQPEEEEIVEPDEEPEPEPDDQPPPDAPPATGITGDGDNGFGLANQGSGGFFGGGGSGGAGRGWSRYASQVKNSIADAVRRHPEARRAVFSVEVRIWADETGLITRASLNGTTGRPELDQILRDEVLTGLRLREAPPENMPMPIVMMLEARRPG